MKLLVATFDLIQGFFIYILLWLFIYIYVLLLLLLLFVIAVVKHFGKVNVLFAMVWFGFMACQPL